MTDPIPLPPIDPTPPTPEPGTAPTGVFIAAEIVPATVATEDSAPAD
jgi:hypothetical protein